MVANPNNGSGNKNQKGKATLNEAAAADHQDDQKQKKNRNCQKMIAAEETGETKNAEQQDDEQDQRENALVEKEATAVFSEDVIEEMKKMKEGLVELRLPKGFQFNPDAVELIRDYLRVKLSGRKPPLQDVVFLDVNLYDNHPAYLVGISNSFKGKSYFFTSRSRKYPNGSRPNRAAQGGYWKLTGKDKPIEVDDKPPAIGFRKALVFYQGKPPKGTKTDWIMHEYLCADEVQQSYKPSDGTMKLDDWVLCTIQKKRKTSNKRSKEQAPSKLCENGSGSFGPHTLALLQSNTDSSQHLLDDSRNAPRINNNDCRNISETTLEPSAVGEYQGRRPESCVVLPIGDIRPFCQQQPGYGVDLRNIPLKISANSNLQDEEYFMSLQDQIKQQQLQQTVTSAGYGTAESSYMGAMHNGTPRDRQSDYDIFYDIQSKCYYRLQDQLFTNGRRSDCSNVSEASCYYQTSQWTSDPRKSTDQRGTLYNQYPNSATDWRSDELASMLRGQEIGRKQSAPMLNCNINQYSTSQFSGLYGGHLCQPQSSSSSVNWSNLCQHYHWNSNNPYGISQSRSLYRGELGQQQQQPSSPPSICNDWNVLLSDGMIGTAQGGYLNSSGNSGKIPNDFAATMAAYGGGHVDGRWLVQQGQYDSYAPFPSEQSSAYLSSLHRPPMANVVPEEVHKPINTANFQDQRFP